jgi:hypothetical protein
VHEICFGCLAVLYTGPWPPESVRMETTQIGLPLKAIYLTGYPVQPNAMFGHRMSRS